MDILIELQHFNVSKLSQTCSLYWLITRCQINTLDSQTELFVNLFFETAGYFNKMAEFIYTVQMPLSSLN